MKIPLAVSEAMFKHARVNRDDLHLALKHMAPHYLKGEYLKAWSDGNPTRYFDYVVPEWLVHFRAPAGSFAFRVPVPGQDAKHYFVRWPDGTIVDLTAEQFEHWELVDYAESKKASMPSVASSRARVLDTLVHAQTGLRSLP
jgi:hypothetical protein